MIKTDRGAIFLKNFLYFKMTVIVAIILTTLCIAGFIEKPEKALILFSIFFIFNIFLKSKGSIIDEYIINQIYPINRGLTQEDLQKLKNYFYQMELYINNKYSKLRPLHGLEFVKTQVGQHTRRRNNLLKEFKKKILENLGNVLVAVVQGEMGSGKSSLFFELLRYCYLKIEKGDIGWVPIVIFGRDITWCTMGKINDIWKGMDDFLSAYFEHLGNDYKGIKNIIDTKYDKIRFLIMIDGLDEITNRTHYLKILKKLENLIKNDIDRRKSEKRKRRGEEECKNNRYVISFRTDEACPIFQDDNLDNSHMRRYTILPLEYKDVIKNLHQPISYYPENLIQNYASNPYLLSLINSHYRYNHDLEKNLRKIFETVLQREIEKFNKTTKKITVFIASFIAPFCYFKTRQEISVQQNQGETQKMKSIKVCFQKYLKKEPGLSAILLGKKGFFQLLYNRRSHTDLYKKLENNWGKTIAKEFIESLEKKREDLERRDQFVKEGILLLYKKILRLLSEYNLVEFNESNTDIKHFRNRLIQYYFTAVYIKTVGIENEKAIINALDKSGRRNILYILASLVEKQPEELIKDIKEDFNSS